MQCCPMDTYDTDSAGDLRPVCTCLDGCLCMCRECGCPQPDDYDDQDWYYPAGPQGGGDG